MVIRMGWRLGAALSLVLGLSVVSMEVGVGAASTSQVASSGGVLAGHSLKKTPGCLPNQRCAPASPVSGAGSISPRAEVGFLAVSFLVLSLILFRRRPRDLRHLRAGYPLVLFRPPIAS